MNPAVSVVIPAFDRAEMIGQAIASVQQQSYAQIELLVVDDGSTDGTGDVARALEGVTVVRTSNGGVASARNVGLEHAKGILITFLDSDDLMPPGRLERDVATLGRQREWAGVLGRQEWFTDGAVMPAWVHKADGEVGDVQPCSGLFRREVFEQVGGFDPVLTHTEDFDWLVRVRDAGFVVPLLDDVVVIRRMHPGNASHARDAVAPQLLQIAHRQIVRTRSRGGGGAP